MVTTLVTFIMVVFMVAFTRYPNRYTVIINFPSAITIVIVLRIAFVERPLFVEYAALLRLPPVHVLVIDDARVPSNGQGWILFRLLLIWCRLRFRQSQSQYYRWRRCPLRRHRSCRCRAHFLCFQIAQKRQGNTRCACPKREWIKVNNNVNKNEECLSLLLR